MNKDVINHMDLVIDEIKNSNEYIKYLELLDKVNKNTDINELVNEIRKIEKELVKMPSIKLEELLKNKQQELNDIPLYLDYKDSLNELNNMMLIIKNKVDKFVSELLLTE